MNSSHHDQASGDASQHQPGCWPGSEAAEGYRELLADAHCHAQDDDPAKLVGVATPALAVMGTREDDWEAVLAVQRAHVDKVIPCFGVHPWFAHQHASAAGSSAAEILDVPEGQDAATFLTRELSASWQPRLRELLQRHPEAIVGECGLDRAAVLPGTKAQVRLSHQLSLLRAQLQLAGELQRPVSLHCVRCYGPLADLLRDLSPDQWPTKLMMHSYGGSAEFAQTLMKLPHGLGRRVYFSFSAVIGSNGPPAKLLDRIRAVPEDRLLLESDQSCVDAIDSGMSRILEVVSGARGCTLQHTARAAFDAFCTFYDGFLPAAVKDMRQREGRLFAQDQAG